MRISRRADDERRRQCCTHPDSHELTLLLSAAVARHPSQWLVPRSINGGDRPCSPNTVEEAVRNARAKVPGLPEKFCLHDLRHYLASLLIASGADIKTVQARGCVTPPPRRHWTSMGICGRTPTSPPGRTSAPRSPRGVNLLRTHCGRSGLKLSETAGQGVS